jgi:hypothetical protein
MRTSPAFATDDSARTLNPASKPAFHLLIDIFPFPCFAPALVRWRSIFVIFLHYRLNLHFQAKSFVANLHFDFYAGGDKQVQKAAA